MFYDYKDFFKSDEKIAVTHSYWIPELVDHYHTFFEIAYVIKGRGCHVMNGVKHPTKTGDLYLLTPKCTHNFIADEDSELEWYNCMFNPSIIEPELIGITDTHQILQAIIFTDSLQYDTTALSDIELLACIEDLNKIFVEMKSEFESKRSGYQEILKGYLQILLVKIFRTYFINQHGSDTKSEITNLVMQYIQEKSIQSKIMLSEIAKKAFYSPRYFSKLFQKENGMTLSNFITLQRIEKACELLSNSDMPIETVMESVGINDRKSFYKTFKNNKHMTPNQYRTLYRK